MTKPLSQTTLALLKAKQLIEEHGWTKRNFHDAGGYCMAGAIMKAVTGSAKAYFAPEVDAPLLVVKRVLSTHDLYVGMAFWNDHVAKSKDEVLAVLTLAIEESMRDG